MKKIIIFLLMFALVLTMCVGCYSKSTEDKISDKQNQLVAEANNKVGMPNITNFFEKRMAKKVMEMRDDSNLICYAYTRSEMTGKYIYEGSCMGFGLPYSVQYTNPMTLQRYEENVGYAYEIVPQADPNGLYMPDSAAATWLMMINEETGEIEPAYYEPEVVVTTSKKPRRLCDESSLPTNY